MNAPITHSLEARYYTDPQVFAIEQAGLLSRTWQFAGHASRVENVGDYFAFEMAGEHLFSIRDRAGQIRTYYNVCQHRAHEMVKGSGNCKVIVCPYHAWSYELEGGLRAAPNTKSVPGFDRGDICLNEVRTELFHGFIFVNLDKDAKPMDDWFPNARAQLLEFVPHIEDLMPLEWVEVPEDCNWKVSIENYSECYHCPTNHPTFAKGVINPKTYDIQPQGHCLRHTTECQGLEDMTYPVDLEANAHAGDYSSWFLWPMFSFQVYPGNILNTYHWRAQGPDKVVVWRGWYSLNGEEDAIARQLAVQDRETTVEEDIHLVESVQRGLGSRGYTPGPLVVDPACGLLSEHSIKTLQQWMREGVDG
jgi:carnitine monooxygenase subunit